MKRLLVIFVSLLLSYFFLPHSSVVAQTPSPNPSDYQQLRCYSECAAYKFGWKGDYCWDTFQQVCSISPKDAVSNLKKLVKGIRDGFMTGKLTQIVDVSYVFKAWFVCKPLIEDCIALELQKCDTTCKASPTYYAANLSVGNPFYNILHGLYYDQSRHTVRMRVVNNGLGYAWDIPVLLEWGHTPNRDGKITSWQKMHEGTIPELLFFGSRQATPKTVGDYVTDFLIDESNFSSFLSRFKSDADFVYIPPAWEFQVPFYPVNGELNRLKFTVDPGNTIPESNEADNTYILDIDDRPTPATFKILAVDTIRHEGSLTEYTVKITVKNDGEETGTATLHFFSDQEGGISQTDSLTIAGGQTGIFTKELTIDVSQGNPECFRYKKFMVSISDDDGITVEHDVLVPYYAGLVSGRVTNKAGKGVAGATVRISTGQQTVTRDSGLYTISGISSLGDIVVSVSHPSYTQPQTKTLSLSLSVDRHKASSCNATGLYHPGVDFTLRDQPTRLILQLRDPFGNPVTGSVMISGPSDTSSYDVIGEKIIEESEVGNFTITASAPGYESVYLQAVLTPPEQIVPIVLKKLPGRPTDEGFSIHKPKLLWELSLPVESKVDDIEGSKNGNLLVVYTSKNAPNTGTLTFIDPKNGHIEKQVSVPSTKGQQQVGLDVSYSGGTVGFMVNPGIFGKTERDRIVKVFGADGIEFGSANLSRRSSPYMAVSPDGFYLYPNELMNKSLHIYSRNETEGKGGESPQSYARSEAIKFTRNHTVIADCKGIHCIKTLADTDITEIGKLSAASRVIDLDFDGRTILFRTDKTLELFGSSSWKKELKRDSAFTSAALTPGGEYAIAAYGGGSNTHLTLGVFTKSGQDVTPEYPYKDVRYVEANDRGMFFTQTNRNTIAYFQIGSYKTQYKPETSLETTAQTTSDMLSYDPLSKTFIPLYSAISWYTLFPSATYKATKEITLSTSWGKITIGKDTIFSKSTAGEPMLIEGYIRIDADAPITMVILKNKLTDVSLMAKRVLEYWLGRLSSDSFIVVKNLHTRYTAEKNDTDISVTAEQGTISVTSLEKISTIPEGSTAFVDGNGIVTVKKQVRWNLWIGMLLGVLCGGGILVVLMRTLQKRNKKDHRKKEELCR